MHCSDAVDEAVERCTDEVQRPKESESVSSLLQALLGKAAEFRQLRLQERPETLRLVRMHTVGWDVFFVVADDAVIVLHPLIRG